MQSALKITVFIVFALFAFTVPMFVISVSADDLPHQTVDYYDAPNVEDYPQTKEGYAAYYKDWLEWFSLNTSANAVNAICVYPETVAEWFGVDDEMKTAIQNSFPDPREVFSQYYMNGGSTEGKSTGGGSSRSPVWSDGHGGKFYVDIISYESGRFSKFVIYENASGEKTNIYGYGPATYDDALASVVSYTVEQTSDPDFVLVKGFVSGENLRYQDFAYKIKIADAHLSEEVESSPVRGKIGGTPVSLKTNPDGSVVAVDDDGNEYTFNPDGTLTINGNDLYLDIDFDTLTDDQLNDINDLAKDWALLNLSVINNAEKCGCKDYTDILKYIATQTYNINENLKKLNTSGLTSGYAATSLDSLFGNDLDDVKTKEDYYDVVSGIVLIFNNMLPLVAINDVMNLLSQYFFKDGSPEPITVTYNDNTYTLLDPNILSTYSNYIEIIKSFVGIVVLYKWLMSMRKKVSNV